MPKKSAPKVELVTQWVKDFDKDTFITDGATIFCKLCKKYVSTSQRSLLSQHVTTAKHKQLASIQTEDKIDGGIIHQLNKNNENPIRVKQEEFVSLSAELPTNSKLPSKASCFLCCDKLLNEDTTQQAEFTNSSKLVSNAIMKILTPIFTEDLSHAQKHKAIITNSALLASIGSQLKNLRFCEKCTSKLKSAFLMLEQVKQLQNEINSMRKFVHSQIGSNYEILQRKKKPLLKRDQKQQTLRQRIVKGFGEKGSCHCHKLFSAVVRLDNAIPPHSNIKDKIKSDQKSAFQMEDYDDDGNGYSYNGIDGIDDSIEEIVEVKPDLRFLTSQPNESVIDDALTITTEDINVEEQTVDKKEEVKPKRMRMKSVKKKSELLSQTGQKKKRKKPIPPFICSTCGKEFVRYMSLKQHQQLHTLPYECSFCDPPKKFAWLLSLQKHEVDNHADCTQFKANFKCDECGKQFLMKNQLQTHKLSHSAPDQRYMCHLCPLTFSFRPNLERHIQNVHEKVRRCHCDVCGKACFDKHDLQSHMLSHTGEKPVNCSVCGKAFRDRKHVRNHELSQHGGELKHVCHLCGKAYPISNYLWWHMKSHRKTEGDKARTRQRKMTNQSDPHEMQQIDY